MTNVEAFRKDRLAALALLQAKRMKNFPNKIFSGSISITDAEFEEVRSLVYTHFGINLTRKKRSLVEGRLQKVVKSLGMTSFREYIDYIKNDVTGDALAELSNRISTNHTFFFREAGHFDFFTNTILPDLKHRHVENIAPRFRMWCAGCSFGDEPYSFAMSLMEFFGDAYDKWEIEMVATDISLAALDCAKAGVYPEDRLKLVPPLWKQKYFTKLQNGSWQVDGGLRRQITFDRINFINRCYPLTGSFHIISCRNVMIYFDQPTRDALIKKFYDYTAPGGYLFIGHSETLQRDNPYFQYVRPAIYQKAGTSSV